MARPLVIVIMGVSGSGKSTIAVDEHALVVSIDQPPDQIARQIEASIACQQA